MFDVIEWKAFLKTRTRKGAEILLGRIAKVLEDNPSLLHCKPYWKDRTLIEAVFTTPLGVPSIQVAIFQALTSAGRIAHHWSVRVPQQYEGGKWDFAAWSDKKTTLSGVVAVELEVRNYK